MSYSYDAEGHSYSQFRRTDPTVAAQIHRALGSALSVINVGAGTGNYEPTDRTVVAVEPSAVMRAQRHHTKAPAVRASSEALPFDDCSFDAAMAILTIHHWPNQAAGCAEMLRVSRGPVVIMSYDPALMRDYWLFDYLPELYDLDSVRFPPMSFFETLTNGDVSINSIEIPHDCQDGFMEGFYSRPEAFLNPALRRAQSAWSLLPPGVEDRCMDSLRRDIEDGTWDNRYGRWREKVSYRGSLTLIVMRPH